MVAQRFSCTNSCYWTGEVITDVNKSQVGLAVYGVAQTYLTVFKIKRLCNE